MARALSLAVALCVLCAALPEAAAICRVVSEPDSPPPVIQPRQSVLFIKRTNVEVGCDEPAGADAGTADAGADDAGADAMPDASIDPPPACEVLSEAITVVVQPRFSTGADGSSFAMLLVTPSGAHIQLEREGIFRELAEATAPEVEVREVYIEDPRLGYQCSDPKWQSGAGCGGGSWSSGGGGGNFDPPDGPADYHDPETDAVQAIGPYAVARLSATTAEELAASLTALGYVALESDIDAIAPYLALGYQAVAVRIDLAAEVSGAGLEPLSLTYPGTEMRLPLGISRQLVAASTSISLYTIAEGRYQFPGAAVSYAQWTRPGEFLTRSNLMATLDQGPEADPIAHHVAGDPTFRDTVTVSQEIRIPSSQCPGSDSDDEGEYRLCGCSGAPGGGGAALMLLALLTFRRSRAARG